MGWGLVGVGDDRHPFGDWDPRAIANEVKGMEDYERAVRIDGWMLMKEEYVRGPWTLEGDYDLWMQGEDNEDDVMRRLFCRRPFCRRLICSPGKR